MAYRDILAHVDSTDASATRLTTALGLARRFGARVSGLHVIPAPYVPPYFKPSVAERVARLYQESADDAAALAESRFHTQVAASGVPTEWRCERGGIAQLLAEHARFADLLVVGQFDTENPPDYSMFLLSQEAVVAAGTPVLVVPDEGDFAEAGRNILVAWDGSREATRAIRDALPMLQAAERVTLLAIDPDRQGHVHGGANPAAMAGHLQRHDVKVEAKQASIAGGGVSDAILSNAYGTGADLLVIGAYGHSRWLEMALGGTTQDLLPKARLPVLMSH